MIDGYEETGETGLEVAVIGMAGRFPGAGNIREFWENLKNGVESVTFFSSEELIEDGVNPKRPGHPNYVKAKGYLENIEYFDAVFFGYTPGEAAVMDPQLRFSHECVWEALEDAGCDPDAYEGLIGVYFGSTYSPGWKLRVEGTSRADGTRFAESLLSTADLISTRLSYQLNLTGPSTTVNSACSTSLVAIHRACRGLLGGECDIALAGGVSIGVPQKRGYYYKEGMIDSPDGHCRAFDARANGTVFGSGIGVVILKRLDEAVEGENHIYAVIKGSAVNNDGKRKVGYTAPSVEGQSEVIRAAYQVADVDPDSIGYIETHGTGTTLGDPIEIKALDRGMKRASTRHCPIGAVKTNIGHLDAAAGAAGFIKTVLCLMHRMIPPTLHFNTGNPELGLEKTPFYVNTELKEWTRIDNRPLRAGVSSFGIGGTNAHVVLEEAPVIGHLSSVVEETGKEREYQLILLSAKTASAMDKMSQNLAEHLKTHPTIKLADAAYTLQVGRKEFVHRKALVCSTAAEAIAALFQPESPAAQTLVANIDFHHTVFMFAGQGSQYINMGLELYQQEPVFRREMDRCFEILTSLMAPMLGVPIKEVLYPGEMQNRSYRSDKSYIPGINQTEVTQPVIFAFGYALAKLLMHWGIIPNALIGYSFGEYMAACLAGVFSLEDALALIVLRGQLMQELSTGAMLSVPLPEEDLKPLLDEGVSIAIVNEPACIVAGEVEAIERFENKMKQHRLMCMRLNADFAVHTSIMADAVKTFETKLRQVTLHEPQIPFISGISGDWINPAEAADYRYWIRHLRETIRFSRGIQRLLEEKRSIFIEIGPGRDLTVLVKRYIDEEAPQPVINLIRPSRKDVSDMSYLLRQMGRLWLYRQDIDWKAFHSGSAEKRYLVPLPTYPFERKPYWIDEDSFRTFINSVWELRAAQSKTTKARAEIDQWFYLPSWKRAGIREIDEIPSQPGRICLIFLRDDGDGAGGDTLGAGLIKRLKQKGVDTVTVTPGTDFTCRNSHYYQLDPRESGHYDLLLEELCKKNRVPQWIVYLWNVTGEKEPPELSEDKIENVQYSAFYSLVYLAQAIGSQVIDETLRILVVSDHMQEVMEGDVRCPEKALLLGPVKVIPHEYPNIRCRSVDIDMPGLREPRQKRLIGRLITEMVADTDDAVIAYRGNQRWVQVFEPVSLEKPRAGTPYLKDNGVYLITGGLGGIGLVLAEHLARQVKAKLILTSRSGKPDRQQWGRVRELEQRGAEVSIMAADAGNRQQMEGVIRGAKERFGTVNGVIHAAGVPDYGGVIQGRRDERKTKITEAVLAPKLKGTVLLASLLSEQGINPDFIVLCSSVASIVAPVGEAAYIAANAFLDAYAHYYNAGGFSLPVENDPGTGSQDSHHPMVYSINWGGWQEVGMAVEVVKRRGEDPETVLKEMILPSEGVEAFDRVLNSEFSQVVVFNLDLNQVLNRHLGQQEELLKEAEETGPPVQSIHQRPELDVPYAAPENEIQEKLVHIWQGFFGLDRVGIDDDFFDLGGDSLKATVVISRIHKKLQVKVSLAEIFDNPTVRKLSQGIGGADAEEFISIEAAEKREYYTSTPTQQRFYVIQQLTPGSTAFNNTSMIPLGKDVDKERLERAFNQLIQRHEALRTSFEIVNGEPVQRIHPEVAFEIEFFDLATEATEITEEEGKNFVRAFDLSKAPLLRVGLVETSEGNYLLMVDMHHLISDGSTHQVLNRDFISLYAGEELSSLRLQYKDFSRWLNRALLSGEMKKHEDYWLKRLQGDLTLLELPTDFPRPGTRRFEGAHYSIMLGSRLTETVNRLVQRTGTTLYMVLLTALNILLSRYTGQQDILIGSPIAGRYHADLEDIIGLVIGGIVMRNYPTPLKTFRELLAEVKTNTLEAYEHQAYPLEELLKKIDWQERPGHDHIIDVALILQNIFNEPVIGPPPPDIQSGVSRQPVKGTHIPAFSKLDMTLYVMESRQAGDISFMFEYCTALFNPGTIERMAGHLVTLLRQVVKDPDVTAADMDIVSDEEKRQMLGSVPSFYPLSHAQKRIYYTDKTYPDSGYHTEPFTVRYNEILDRSLLEKAINILIRKNEGLRLRLVELEFQNEPLQYIAPYTPYSLEEKTEQWIGEDILKPHPMVNNPLYYFAYIKFNEKESGFYMKFHHLVSDGWSVIFMLNEITSVYDALKAGETVDEAPNPSYLEYLCDERDYLRSSRAEKDRAFWHRYLLPLPETVQLKKHAADTPIKNLATKGKILAFPGELRANMHRFRKNHKTSLFKLLLSGLSIYVSRVTGSEDTVTATTNHNRTTERQRKMTGMFVSIFPLRVKADAAMTFRDFVERNSSDVNYILKNHQRYPFDLLLEELRDAAGTDPLNLLNINLIGHPDIEEARYRFKRHFTLYDPSPLTIHINLSNRDISGVLELQWHYQPQVFSGQDIEQIHQGLINILDDALTHPDKQLSEIELVSRKEKELILYRFNDTAAAEHYPQDKSVHQLFEEQAARTPGHTAVVGREQGAGGMVYHLSYGELNEKASQLAYVLKEKGVLADDIVAIMVEPSIEMIIGILGILKAGGAYLPIDPEYPRERIDYMLTDSGAAFLLTAGEILDVFKDKGTACCAPTITCNLHLSLAYIIYTSGTTGRPKGTLVEHRNLMAYLNAFENEFGLRASDVVIQQASFAFDAFVEELYPILLKGGRLAIPQRHEVKDVERLKEYILEQNITMITCSPLLLNELNRRGAGGTIRIFISGGDRLKAEYVERLVKSNEAVVYNTYGPTEGTVCASYYRCQPGDPASVPIGKPISNYELYITDRYGHLLPVGVPGELCITGPGVARGYLNQPELTADKFFNYRSYRTYRTYSSYKTGDLACWLPDGNIEFLGRMDRQVKIRGYRIELGEIENRLNNHYSVKESVVVDKKDRSSDTYLCAYIVPGSEKGDKTFDPSVLREYLTGLFPGYMVPSRFAVIDKIPLTPGGKVDARTLPDPDAIGGGRYAAPRNELEEKLESIWQRVLAVKKDKIGIDADFFELGGHSLKATSVISIIHRELDLQVPLMELFNAPTIRGLARYLRDAFQSRFVSIEAVEQKEYYPLSSAQKRLYILQQMQPQDTFYNMPYVIPLAEGARIEKLEAVFGKLIERHEILRTSFAVVNEEPVQRVHDEVEFKIEYYHAALQDFVRSFDLSQAPLLRVGLIKSGTSGHTLLLDMHHIATDGTSQEILTGEFTALVADPETELPLLRLQYRDFSRWESSTRQQEIVKQQRDYWLREFSGELPVLHLPTDFPRPQVQSSEGNVVYFVLDREETNILKAIVEEYDVTLYMVLLAVFNLLLSRLSGQEDIILGTPIAARRHADLQGIVGMLVNTLAMRNYPSANKTFPGFLKEIKQRTLEAYENQEYHFEELVNHLAIERDTSRNPVFDVMLNLLNQSEYPGEIPVFDKQTPQISEHNKRTSRFDMTWSAVDFETFIGFTLEYSTRLFTPATSERFIRYLKTIIFNLRSAENRERELCDIPVLPEEEKQEILQLSRGIEIPAEEPRPLHRLFEERAGKAPDSTALVFEEQHVSYGELNCQANRLARFLREKGVGVPPGTVVGVVVERSLEMIIAILAILKAGGAYLPIDPEYPEQRILAMLMESGASILLTRGNLLGRFSITAFKNMKAREEHLVITPPREHVEDFDNLPIPDRTLIDYDKYHRYIGEAPAQNTITMQATRGCPYSCLYCHKIWPKTHVARSAENVFKEISYAYDAGLRRFVFIDDIFNLDQKNASRLLETLIKRNLDIQLFFPNGFRADILTKDFIDLMMAAGTVNLDVALESASPRIQRLIGKNLNLEKFKEHVQYITGKYPHVILEMEMMHGFPTETEEEAMMTLDFLKEFKWVHFPNLHVLKIYPNTGMCRFAMEKGISAELIERSANLAYHELPDTLPFPKSFTRQFQAKFMGEYFLLNERLLDVLPHQMKILTEEELVQKYDSYLSFEVKHFSDILQYAGISREELGEIELKQGDYYQVPDFTAKISKYFPVKEPSNDAFRILLLDLSQLFSEEHEHMLHHQVEEPLGLLYLMSYLNEIFKDRISGKVFKSKIDFDSYGELKKIITDFNPDLIGIRTLSFYKEFFHKAVLMIRQWGVEVPIVAGGPYATSDYKLILQDPHVDVVVLGEGELTLGQLVEKMMESGNRLPGEEILAQIHGIAFARSQYKSLRNVQSREVILLDEVPVRLAGCATGNLEPVSQHHDLLYVIYTSGSTGRPKGIMMEHGNLVNLIRHQHKYTNIDFSRVLQFTTISFDVSAQEIFSTLISGGQLTLVSKGTLNDVPELFRLVERNRLKTLFVPASFLKFVISEEEYTKLIPKDLAHIVTAGEQLIVNDTLRKYLRENRVYLHNHYGPAETHVVTAFTLDPREDVPTLPAVGKPILNTAVYIVDKGMNLAPVGVPGELLIGGIQVGRGYLNRPELTKEKFLSVSYKSYMSYRTYSSKKIYKTGDLARWVKDGNIEFLGRIDLQVKIRGFRIEPGEIENRLMGIPGVKEAVVVDREDEVRGKYLCAYVVCGESEAVEVEELRDRLSRELPDYMVPAYFVRLEKILLTPTGKVDRKRLPEPEVIVSENFAAPETEEEKKLAAIWSEILGIERDRISVLDNFFALGGHSLKATIMISKIHRVFNVRMPLLELFKTPVVRKLAQYITGTRKDLYTAIESAEQKEYYPLSSSQKRLYVLQQMELENTSYNMSFVLQLPGDADKEKLEKAFNKLITRHEMLRTSFQLVGEVPVQRVHKQVNFTLEEYDIENLEPGERDMAAFIENFKKPFDLSRVPLLRAARIKVEGETRVMVMDMHHIITDGTSQDILKEDFAVLYKGEDLPPLKLQCKDFSHWQNSRKQQEVVKRQGDYWMREFSDELPVLHLPADFPRPKVQSSEGNVVHFVLNREETNILKDIVEEHDITLYMVLSAVFNILFSKLSGQEDIVLGTPVAARRHADLQRVVGMLVNTLAMRNYPSADKTFPEFLNEIKRRTLEAYENQEYHFEDLVGHLAIDRDASRNPVFDVMLNLLNQAEYSGEIPVIDKQTAYISEHKKGTSRFDMTWSAVDFETFIGFTLEYSTRLFTPATSERFIRYLKNIILHLRLPESRRQRLGDIPLLNQEEKQEILYFSRGIEKVVEGPGTLHQMFEEQAARTPDGVAVVCVGRRAESVEQIVGAQGAVPPSTDHVSITYKELDKKSNQLAHLLIEKGVLADDIIGIMMERSVEMIIGMLGILKAGGAYLPIDPEYPRERIDYMLKDSGAAFLLTVGEILDVFKDKGTACCAPTITCNLHLSLAYIIYTSGTTGRPKGVSIQHRSVVNMVWYQRKVFNENPGSRISQASSAVFDGMTIEVWPCLLSGACLCIVDNETRMDPVRLKDWLIRHQVTISFQSTLIALMLLEEQWPETGTALEVLQAGGDRLNRYPAGSYPFRFYNIYGPTEDTAWATCTEVPTVSPSERTGPPPIGKPAGNKQVYILSRDLELQPLGVAGELCIGGAGLSRGYLNRPELTAEKFFNYRSYRTYRTYISKKIYKTGDLACWQPDGNIEFLGRMDHQVKIRGFRIELGEIESILLKHLEINECVVLAKTGTTPGAAEISGDKYLCAYIVSTRELPVPELRDYLGTYLPHHMIPSFFVFLKEIPLTVNGKIDRKALPEPEMTGTVEYMPPRNEVEKKLVEVWSGVLGIEVGISDSFFHVGGDSIKAIQVSARLRKHDLHVKISDLFLYPEIKDLAKFVTKIQRDVDRVTAAGNRPDVGHRDITPEKLSWLNGYIRDNIPGNPEIDVMYSLSPLQKTMLYHSLSGANQDVFFIQQLSRWQGTIENSLLETSLKILVERHDIFRTVFIYEELDEPLQIVLNRRTIEFAYEDVSRGKEEERLLCLEEYRKKDVKRGFDLSKDMLVRITLFRLDVNSYVLMWSNHYILMDGWCVGIVFKELVQIYESLRTGNPIPLEKVTPYRNYITWLEGQDKAAGFRYWENYLAGYCHHGDLIPTQPGKLEKEDEYNFKSYTFEIDKDEIDSLKQLAANFRVTLNTVFQSLWGVLLQRYNNREDVVFGAVVSGRPPEIEGIENMVGLFINSVPVRVKAGQDFKFRQLLKTMQENSTAAKSYEYLPFTEILAKCQLKENIIDHLMTFQNIVFMEQFKSKYNPDAGAAAAFKIESSLYHQSNYNFNIIITPVTPFQVEFLYNAPVYEEVFLKRIQQHLKEIIRQVIADKDIKLEDIGITYDYLAAESSFLHQEEEEEWNI